MSSFCSRLLFRCFLLLSLLSRLPLQAQPASLVADLTAPSGFSTPSSNPVDLTPFRGKLIFAAEQPGSGRELWVSEGDDKGTHLLADFCPGACGSSPDILGATRSLVFGSFGKEGFFDVEQVLWRSDGTKAGTYPLPDADDPVRVAALSDYEELNPSYTAVLGSYFYFPGCNHSDECGLWRSDGTAAGTAKVVATGGNYPFGYVAVAGNRVYFASGLSLWVTDGTAAGTRQLLANDAFARLLTPLGDKLYFLYGDAAHGQELWVSDGSAAGTRRVTDIASTEAFGQTRFLKALGGKLYFVVNDVLNGAELWVSDGTAAGSKAVTEFGFHDPFHVGDDPFDEKGLPAADVELVGSRIVFWATDGLHGFQPWATTGTPASTTPLCPSCSFSNEQAALLKTAANRLVFAARDAAHGAEFWSTNGTPQGTQLLKDLCNGTCDGARWEPVPALGLAFLAANEGNRATLWASDGTVQGTRRYADTGAYVSADFGIGPALVALGNVVYYAGGANQAGGYGVELWRSNGTPAGTRPVTDIARGNGSTDFEEMAASGRDLFFVTCSSLQRFWHTGGTPETTVAGSGGPNRPCDSFDILRGDTAGGVFLFPSYRSFESGPQLWRMDADGAFTQLTHLDEPETEHYIVDLASLGDRLVFAVEYTDGQNHLRTEIWRSDGTAQGTVKATELPFHVVGPFFFTVVGSEVWFSLYDKDQNGGSEMWRTDGTAAGTHLATDLGEGRTVTDPMFTKIGSTVFFVGADPDNTRQIWRSDGTPAGSSRVRDLDPFPNDELDDGVPADLTALNGILYFSSRTSNGKSGLWRSDGTEAGTFLVRDFVDPVHDFNDDYDGQYWPSPLDLKAVGQRLVFAANENDTDGRQLWVSDGTAAGTVLLRDLRLEEVIDLHVKDTFFQAASGRLFFAADDGVHGFELWETDGTPAGTRLVQDLAPEGDSSDPRNLRVAGDRLYFTANDGAAGRELWVLPLGSRACQASGSALCLASGRFEVRVAWRDFAGNTGDGHAVPLTGDTGYFWFFDAANVETVVKVLDGRGTNGHFWVFFGALSNVEYTVTVTDTETGATRRYFNPRGTFASVGDTQGFGPQGAFAKDLVARPSGPALVAERFDPAAATGTCVPTAVRLCLNGGRFAVEAAWKDFANHTGIGTAAPLSGDTGYFWFFSASNVEVVVKVLDGIGVNGHHWLFYGALSNVEYTLTVTDTMTGTVKSYKNPSGRFASIGDTVAF